MSANVTCGSCGAPLVEASGRGGNCHRCLLEAALSGREGELRKEILQLATASERIEYLDAVCGDDPSLRHRMLDWVADLEGENPADNVDKNEKPTVRSESSAAFGPCAQSYPGTAPNVFEQIGPFRILERIGEGGMGIVYKAEQQTPICRIVALKVLKLGMDSEEVVARFEAERQALAMLSHPNVARVFDAGMTDNRWTELVD